VCVRLNVLTVTVFLEQKVDEAKSSGQGWLSWGRSQTRDAADDLKCRADGSQEVWKARFEKAERKAAEKGEDVKQHPGETEDEFRNCNRNAKACETCPPKKMAQTRQLEGLVLPIFNQRRL
jgi:hypothetical protein